MQPSFPIIYVMGALIAVAIIVMSVIFLVKAIKRGKAIGMSMKIMKDAIKNSAIFSIVPSIPIVIGVGIMMQYLGLAIPWIRLTVIGALQYELIAMDQVGLTTAAEITTQLIATAFFVMTLSIVSGPIFNAVFYKKYQNKLASLQKKNEKLMNTITGALMAGLLAGILSSIIVGGAFSCGKPIISGNITTYGEVTLITLASSFVIMGLCGAILVFGKQKWIESYALPITIIGALAVAYACVPAFAG